MGSVQRNRWLKHWKRELILAGFALGLVALVSMLILSSLRIHMDELQWQFRRSELLEGSISHVHLVAKFENHRKLFLETISRRELDQSELELTTSLKKRSRSSQGIRRGGFLEAINLWLIDGLRIATDKPRLPQAEEIEAMDQLEKAYQLERDKEYQAALDLYRLLLPKAKDIRLHGIILLHQGFCQALLGNDNSAQKLYREVIDSHNDDDLGIVATLLLRHLQQILLERDRLVKANFDALAKARKLSELLRCQEALAQFDSLETLLPESHAQIALLRGTCLEETGKKTQAVASYLKAIDGAGKSALARDANRRIFVMGAQSGGGDGLRQASNRLDSILQDPSLTKMRTITDTSASVAGFDETQIQEVQRQLEPVRAKIAKAPKEVITELQSAKIKLPPVGTKARIVIRDGKVFKGEILSDASSKVVRIHTMIGTVGLPYKDIVKVLPP